MSANHGNTPAAWTAVTLILLGSCVAGWAVVAASPVLGAIGALIIGGGGIVGKVMQMMGMGQKSYTTARD